MNHDTERTESAEDTSRKAHGHVRPTIRCLLEDLRGTIGAGKMREALRTAEADLKADARCLHRGNRDHRAVWCPRGRSSRLRGSAGLRPVQ